MAYEHVNSRSTVLVKKAYRVHGWRNGNVFLFEINRTVGIPGSYNGCELYRSERQSRKKKG